MAEKVSDETKKDPWDAVRGLPTGQSRIMHTMLRTKDIDRAVKFYSEAFGMRLVIGGIKSESTRVSAAFIGYKGLDEGGTLIELADFWDEEGPYTHGTAYGHVALGMADLEETIKKLEAMGVEVDRHATGSVWVKDPDGYQIELLQARKA